MKCKILGKFVCSLKLVVAMWQPVYILLSDGVQLSYATDRIRTNASLNSRIFVILKEKNDKM